MIASIGKHAFALIETTLTRRVPADRGKICDHIEPGKNMAIQETKYKTKYKTTYQRIMERLKRLHIHQRLYLIAAAILLAGALSGAAIVALTPPDPDMSFLTDGTADFGVPKAYSRRYQYDVGRIGGQGAVLAAQLDDWFGALWQGKQLGYTVAELTAIIALVFFCFGRLLSVRVLRRKIKQ
jgi:hypothetical protein